MLVIATPTERLPRNFQQLIQVTVEAIKRLSQNWDIGDLRSGQICALSIIKQWQKNEGWLFWTKNSLNTLKHRLTGKIDTLNRKIVTGEAY